MLAAFRCRCGEVQGHVSPVKPGLVNRAICYCDDCQAFAHYLGRADLLNAQGGSDVVQFPPASVTFTHGQHKIEGVRLSAKGLRRWRALCCQTPVGYAVSPAVPFVGMFASSFEDPDLAFGRPRGAFMGQFAIGEPPPGSKGMNPWLLVSSIAKVLRWRLTGRNWPHPFFAREDSRPLYPVTTLSAEERERLRPLCGPRPTAGREREA